MKSIYFFLKLLLLLPIAIFTGCGGNLDSENTVEIVDFSPYVGQVTRSAASWYVINSNPPFGPRDHTSLIKVNNRIHLMGGFYRGPSVYQDYWISDDYGINWLLIHGNPLPLKNDLTYPIFYSSSSIPGPYARFSYYDSLYWLVDEYVWYSRDGIIWNKHSESFASANGAQDIFSINHQGVQYWIDPSSNLIWNNRPNFERADKRQVNADFKIGQGAVVYSSGKHLYIAGGVSYNYGLNSNGVKILLGQDFNNVLWRSVDGISWKRVVDKNNNDIQLPWVNIQWPCVVADNKGRVFLLGGYNIKNNKNSSDVWYTSDGINWVKYEDMIASDAVSALFPRHAAACVFDEVNNRIISIAGKGGINPDNDTSFVTKDVIGIPIP